MDPSPLEWPGPLGASKPASFTVPLLPAGSLFALEVPEGLLAVVVCSAPDLPDAPAELPPCWDLLAP